MQHSLLLTRVPRTQSMLALPALALLAHCGYNIAFRKKKKTFPSDFPLKLAVAIFTPEGAHRAL